MPSPLPCWTTKPFQTRASPPRRHATINPSKTVGEAGSVEQPGPPVYPGTFCASTTGNGPAPAVIVEPSTENVSPLPAVSESVVANSRVCVDAPTVVVHGPRWSAVPAPGPELPAEADTNTPAA